MSGIFSTVEKKALNERPVAVKTYWKRHGRLVRRHCERELWAWRTLSLPSEEEARHRHIIYFLDIEESETATYITMPSYVCTLAEKPDKDLLAHQVLQQIARALVFIHRHGIVHCDLSPTNILLDTMGRMVIIDFGCAHALGKNYQTDDPEDIDEIGTRPYKAPEHLFGHRIYTPATDIWSLGAIVGELLLGRRVFRGESDLEAIGSIVRTLGPPPKEVQDREMRSYPDADKLVFFNFNIHVPFDEDDEDSTEDDLARLKPQALEDMLEKSQMDKRYQRLLKRMLTWSVEDRIRPQEVLDSPTILSAMAYVQ